jgi:hydrogenase-1 operon protein HyaF
MTRLEDIAITLEPGGAWENALPILHQVRHALQRLTQTGEPSVIDLRSLPFGPGDEDRLVAFLGSGEVRATVNALGPTRVWETGFAGVWMVEYQDTEGARIGLQIEVTALPSILRSPPEDVAEAGARLAQRLQETDGRLP